MKPNLDSTIADFVNKLRKEHDEVDGEYQALYERLGRNFFHNLESPSAWSVQSVVSDIKRRNTRQETIRELIQIISREAPQIEDKQ